MPRSTSGEVDGLSSRPGGFESRAGYWFAMRLWCSSNTPLFQSGFAGANPAGCTVGDRLIEERAHDVAVAYRLAIADVWGQIPLGALVDDELRNSLRPCDVVAAFRLGMADVWVRLPPGALGKSDE